MNARIRLYLLIFALVTVASSVMPRAVSAADPAPAKTPEEAFAVLDEDGNGQIDRAEWQTRKMAVFYARDADRNLELSRRELPGLAPDAFSKADLDRNGTISGYEFNQAPFSRFDDANTDDDEGVSVSEFRAYIEGGGAAR